MKQPGPTRRSTPRWQASKAAIAAVVGARHGDPFAVLGPHRTAAGVVIRALVPGATSVEIRGPDGGTIAAMLCRHPDGFFEVRLPTGREPGRYRLFAANADANWEFDDPFRFGPILGALDDHLLVEGTHQTLYERLGAHPMTLDGTAGVHFAVWAPNARRVSVVGDFNAWDGRRHPMRKRIDSGLWEIFAPGIGEGAVYKFELAAADGTVQPLKADPFGFAAEMRPSTASVVARTDNFPWTDAVYMHERGNADARRRPIAIYEVHLGSWRRGENGTFLTYNQIADQMIPYVA
ncbi:MAG TPA: 1,4-alpha-glucan branching enzyme, partial [Acetobacteraceae bacterium]|nr:1,4-alpha-glucan branching enzyme [Acetobacteraceae bacterium]